jgi:hypothetical protein
MSIGKPDRSILSPQMNATLTPAQAAQSARQLSALGHLIQMNMKEKIPLGNGTSVYYVYQGFFTSDVRQILISVTSEGKVDGFQVVP